jgi:hypothetical protein
MSEESHSFPVELLEGLVPGLGSLEIVRIDDALSRLGAEGQVHLVIEGGRLCDIRIVSSQRIWNRPGRKPKSIAKSSW